MCSYAKSNNTAVAGVDLLGVLEFHIASTSKIRLMVEKQEAQLLQRDRAMLRVMECFDKSFKVTQGHSKLHT